MDDDTKKGVAKEDEGVDDNDKGMGNDEGVDDNNQKRNGQQQGGQGWRWRRMDDEDNHTGKEGAGYGRWVVFIITMAKMKSMVTTPT